MAHWLRFCTPNAGGLGWSPGWGTKIPQALLAAWCGQKITKILKDINKLKKKRVYAFKLNFAKGSFFSVTSLTPSEVK